MKLRMLASTTLASALVIGLVGTAPATSSTASDSDTASVTGVVTFNGEPFPGAEVTLEPATEDGDYIRPKRTRTGRDGVFTFAKVPAQSKAPSGEWLLVVDGASQGALDTYHPGTVRRGDATRFALKPGTVTTANVDMVAGAALEGRVVDEAGIPMAGISVDVYEDGTWVWPADTTDAHGNFRKLGLGGGEVEVAVEQYLPDRGTWVAGRTTVTTTRGTTTTMPDLVVVPAPAYGQIEGKIKGKIKRVKEGDTVYLYDMKTRLASRIYTPVKGGSLKVKSSAPPGRYRLVLGGTNTASKAFTVTTNQTTKVPTFKGPKKRLKLSGKVRRANGKLPKNARLYVYDKFGTFAPNLPYETRRKVRKGKYTVNGLGKGKYTIEFRAFPSRKIPIIRRVKIKTTAGKTFAKNFKLPRTASVSGTVTNGSQPVRGIEILIPLFSTGCPGDVWEKHLSGMCRKNTLTLARTDATGRFTIDNLPVGKHVLVADDPTFGGYRTVAELVKVRKKGTTWNVQVSEG